ncbi:HopJ type III effector protein [Psychromonas sp. KJ10-10]|uniref:HopJ type III effector protein n=1 Tax=Psychromonas sp. KJ10-10 TaxID=3391823 RepID=UPI0039B3A347
MLINAFLEKLNHTPDTIAFNETMAVIEENYTFSAVAFSNGEQKNAPGENSGSCKLFAFAQLQELNKEQTLACFGDYYRIDVLQNPNATDHQNIRQFMLQGWSGISFDAPALTAK